MTLIKRTLMGAQSTTRTHSPRQSFPPISRLDYLRQKDDASRPPGLAQVEDSAADAAGDITLDMQVNLGL